MSGAPRVNEQSAPLRAHLLYVQIGSPDPERLARFYATLFDLSVTATPGGWVCRRPHQCLAFAEGPANTLISAGYAVGDSKVLASLAARAKESLTETAAIDAVLLQPGAVAFRDPDGNRVVYGLPAESSPPRPSEASSARLQHVVVGSTDVEQMVAFYSRVVGLRVSDEVRDEQGGLRACFLRTDDEHHSFAVFRTTTHRLDHYCHELPDWNGIRDWADRLAARDIPVKWGPGRHGPGNNLFLFFHDPDGNWVELSAELQTLPADRPAGTWRHEERTLNQWGRAYLRS